MCETTTKALRNNEKNIKKHVKGTKKRKLKVFRFVCPAEWRQK